MAKYINADELIKALEKYMAQIENSKNFVYTNGGKVNDKQRVD